LTLIQAALDARAHSFSPYSNFAVGAAVQLVGGTILTGCNIESASYGLTVCAERVALWKAVSQGARPGDFAAIAVAADSPTLTPPCGACRQLLWEFCGDIPVTLVDPRGHTETLSLASLIPRAFGTEHFR
jgi:cytidine deaminase